MKRLGENKDLLNTLNKEAYSLQLEHLRLINKKYAVALQRYGLAESEEDTYYAAKDIEDLIHQRVKLVAVLDDTVSQVREYQ